jgi:uroporphyrinogen-III synthase
MHSSRPRENDHDSNVHEDERSHSPIRSVPVLAMKRVLVTGPLESMSDYCRAAEQAGWSAIELPLLRVVPHRHDVSSIVASRFDWICITSTHAVGFLSELARAADGLRATPCAVVGERSSGRAREIGFHVELTADSATALADEMLRRVRAGARVLWPHGHLSDDFARRLREADLAVTDPVVYSTEPIEHIAAPPAEAILFASPSGVRAWHAPERARAEQDSVRADAERDPASGTHTRMEHNPVTGASTEHDAAAHARAPNAPRVAIAIGETTLDALMSERDLGFHDTISLPEPTPEAFGFVLFHLDLGRAEGQ